MNKVSIEEILHKVATGDRSIDWGCVEIQELHDQSRIGQQSTIFDKETHHFQKDGSIVIDFKGSDYIEKVDGNRLKKQYIVIRDLMSDGKWRTLKEIESITGYPQSSISAQLRNLRKEAFGGHTIDKQRRGKVSNGLFEYRLRYYKELEWVRTPKRIGTFIHYCEYDSTECTVDIDGVWISFDLKQLSKYKEH